MSALKLVKKNSVASEAHLYELLFEEAGDAILLVDCDTKTIASANLRLQELTGFVAAELEGQAIAQLFPVQAPKVRSALFNSEMLEHSGFYEDMALLRKDGYLAFATLSVKTLPAAQTDGRNLAFCILHDMGAKKSMERDLLAKHWELKEAYEELNRAHMEVKSAQEALVQAGKLAALGELAAGVAHELNQPLAGVMGFGQELESLLKEKFPDATALDFAGEVTRNAVRMKKIIQQLREFTRRSTEDFRATEMRVVVEDSLKLLEQQFRSRGIEVKVSEEAGLPAIYCNPFQLEQVFINLATNARDAIEASGRGSGRVEIELRRKASDSDRFVEILFRDDGTGMDLETKNRALEPFYTTKEVGKGTGLGLSVSYGILSKIHGTMMIESSPGKGTAFLLTLPVDYRTLNSQGKKEG
ncbi:MAG: PAS domain S-box protein [Proteobacteria bacterium]|nr:MAG: PAS domain S-box protein [Pseudomonadota bacterium]